MTVGAATPVLELLVVEGDDTGQQFTIDGPEVRIARGTPRSGRPGDVLLRDPTVSRDQAVIRQAQGVVVIEHRASARSPTLLNGMWVDKRPLSAGDKIQVGRVVIEVRARGGTSLTTLLDDVKVTPPEPQKTSPRTELRRSDATIFAIKLMRGWPELEGRRFRLQPERTVIGRSEDCDVCIPEGGVSRVHAELLWERNRLRIVHRSATNPTFVNGSPVEEPRTVEVGDEIELADRVSFKVERATVVAASQSPTSLLSHLERKMEGAGDVDEKFRVEGSFLDVDVADSYGMKAASTDSEGIILSFARWRAWISRTVREFEGQVLNSNGDELMCFFDEPRQAVRAGSEILRRLESFNGDQNMLETPFKLRIGVHTGSTLLDRERGVAFSPVLDVAGHLQKMADVNGLLVSQDTMDRLAEGLPFEQAGELEREGIATYRMTRFLE